LTVTISAIGSVPRGRMVRRSGARPGDLVFLSGTLGDSALGLAIRRDAALAASWGLDGEATAALVARYLRPMPRVRLAPHLLAHASAAMDVSDGLVKDCGRLASASGVAVTLEAKLVPLSAAARLAVDAQADLMEAVLTGGDDYEVLATVPPAEADAFRAAAQTSGVDVTAIGRVLPADASQGTGVTVMALDGRPWEFERGGWDHFPG
jgi:thiamine-monophosphate kinase